MFFRKISLRGLQWYIIFSLAYPLWCYRNKCPKTFGYIYDPLNSCMQSLGFANTWQLSPSVINFNLLTFLYSQMTTDSPIYSWSQVYNCSAKGILKTHCIYNIWHIISNGCDDWISEVSDDGDNCLLQRFYFPKSNSETVIQLRIIVIYKLSQSFSVSKLTIWSLICTKS